MWPHLSKYVLLHHIRNPSKVYRVREKELSQKRWSPNKASPGKAFVAIYSIREALVLYYQTFVTFPTYSPFVVLSTFVVLSNFCHFLTLCYLFTFDVIYTPYKCTCCPHHTHYSLPRLFVRGPIHLSSSTVVFGHRAILIWGDRDMAGGFSTITTVCVYRSCSRTTAACGVLLHFLNPYDLAPKSAVLLLRHYL